ncbi:response regulator [Marinihelvus fidelis]|uniref:Response regulator n=1 Tax=Marinihelvus fidelis TaxID=2613842 RepID=A0A5N0THW9_9GAMM|nr:response regulator [Marinihelvus fidelis]KAA9134054.1 response regulator [Marinihelvus fidelis]
MTGLKVLIVDDNPVKAREISREILGIDLEASVDVANTVNEAKRKLVDWYDVLFLDLVLPLRDGEEPRSGSGIELLGEIEENDRFRLPPHVFAISEYGDQIEQHSEHFENRILGLLAYDETSNEWKKKLRNRLGYLLESRRRREASVSDGYDVDVAIICALRDPELKQVLALSDSWSDEVPFNDTTRYWRTELQPQENSISVVACHVGDMGSTPCAILCSKVVRLFRPKFLILTGICAGMKETGLGDVLVGDPVWNYLSGKLCQEEGLLKLYAAPKQLRLDPRVIPIIEKVEDSGVVKEAYDSWKQAKPQFSPKVHIGPIVSGSSVVADDSGNIQDMVLSQNRKTVGLEMEAYGAMYAASVAPAPPPIAIVVKSVCDFADGTKNDDYQDYAAYTSARFCAHLIPNLVSNLNP